MGSELRRKQEIEASLMIFVIRSYSPYYTSWSVSGADTRTLCNWEFPDGTVGSGTGPDDNIAAIEVSQLSHAHSIRKRQCLAKA